MSNGVNNGDKLTGKRHFEDANEFGRRDYMSALGSNKSASKEIELADDEEYIRLHEEEERRVIEQAKLEEKRKLEEAKRLEERQKNTENERKRVEEQLKRTEAECHKLEEERVKVEEQLRQAEDSHKNDKTKYLAIALGILFLIGLLLSGNNSKDDNHKVDPPNKNSITSNVSGESKVDNAKEEELKRKETELQRREAEIRFKEEQLRKKDEEIIRVKKTYSNNLNQRQAATFLLNYFKDIDNKDFYNAWKRIHPSLRQSMFASFDGYKTGFKNTYSQDVKIRRVDLVSSNRATVYFDLYAKDRENGRLVSNNFTGRWDIVKEGDNTFMDNPSVRRM